ncbi:MAG: hypothetical protein KA190_13390 [Kofleriaceae bacterium]|nr:hypothetical protein [Kofleriaceae bacterium]
MRTSTRRLLPWVSAAALAGLAVLSTPAPAQACVVRPEATAEALGPSLGVIGGQPLLRVARLRPGEGARLLGPGGEVALDWVGDLARPRQSLVVGADYRLEQTPPRGRARVLTRFRVASVATAAPVLRAARVVRVARVRPTDTCAVDGVQVTLALDSAVLATIGRRAVFAYVYDHAPDPRQPLRGLRGVMPAASELALGPGRAGAMWQVTWSGGTPPSRLWIALGDDSAHLSKAIAVSVPAVGGSPRP